MSRILFISFAFLLFGCGLRSASNMAGNVCSSDPPDVHQKRLDAYGSTLKAFLKTQVCTTCHNGSSAPYPFVETDADGSYSAARELVDFENPDNSRMPVKIRSGHNCGSSDSCNSLASSISGQISAWATAESGLTSPQCASNATVITTTSLPIDPAHLSATTDQLLRWDLSALQTPYPGAAFQMAYRQFSDTAGPEAAYQLWKPILATQTDKLRITSIELLVNGQPDPSSRDFVNTNFVVGPMSFSFSDPVWGSFPVVNPAVQLRPIPTSPEMIAFRFNLEKTTDATSPVQLLKDCKDHQDFDGPVAQNILSIKCSACHSSGGAGFSAFPMFGAGVNTCLEALIRSDTATPMNSLLIHKPNDPIAPHQLVPLSASDITAITTWLSKEFSLGN